MGAGRDAKRRWGGADLLLEERRVSRDANCQQGRCTFLLSVSVRALLTRQFELFLFTFCCRWWWKWQQIWSGRRRGGYGSIRVKLQPRPASWCCVPRHGRSRSCKGFERKGQRCAAKTRRPHCCCQTQQQRTTGPFPIAQEWREGNYSDFISFAHKWFFFLTSTDESNERLGGRTQHRMYDGNKTPRDKSVILCGEKYLFMWAFIFLSRTNKYKQQTINYERASGKPANGWTPPVGTKVTTDTYRG